MRKHFGLILVLAAAGYFVWRFLVKPTDVKANAIGPATSAVVNGRRVFVTPPGQQAVMAPDGTWWNVSVNSIRDSIASFFGNGAGPSNVAAAGGTALAPQVNDAPGPAQQEKNPGPVTIAAGVIPTSKQPMIVDHPGPAQRQRDPGPVPAPGLNSVAVSSSADYPELPDNHPLNENPRAGLFMTPTLDGGPITVTEEYSPALKSVDYGDGDTDNVVTTIPTIWKKWKGISNEIM